MRAIDADAISYKSIDSCDTGRHEHYYGTGIIAVRKEDIDARNEADQLVYQSEKALGEFGDKVDASEKDAVNTKINELKEALKGEDIEAIKTKKDELQKAFYDVAGKVYQQQAAAQQGADANATDAGNTNPDDNVVDADYTDAE